MEKKVLVIGSLNMDLVIHMDKMPEKGETVLGKSLAYIPGGKGANQACALGKLGAKTAMLGCVGQDVFGKTQLENLKKNQVDISGIRQTKELPTGTAVISVDSTGDNNIIVVAGANQACDEAYLKSMEQMFEEFDYIVFQMEIPCEAVYYGIRKAKEKGKTVILNPAPAPREIPEEILRCIDYLTPNETELASLAGLSCINEETIRTGASDLLKKGVKNVLVTLGEKGVYFAAEGEEKSYPARKVKAVDTTAAGDCFNGAFVTALAEGKTVSNAIAFANLASSIAVTRNGAQSSLPQREEVDALF